MAVIKGGLVPLGNSVAIAVSKKEAKARGWKLRQEIDLVELGTGRKQLLEKMFGFAKGAEPFERDEE